MTDSPDVRLCNIPAPGSHHWKCELTKNHSGYHYSERRTTAPPSTDPVKWPSTDNEIREAAVRLVRLLESGWNHTHDDCEPCQAERDLKVILERQK